MGVGGGDRAVSIETAGSRLIKSAGSRLIKSAGSLGMWALVVFVCVIFADPFSLGLLMPIKSYFLQTFFFRIVNAH